jgi:hypothetical protein
MFILYSVVIGLALGVIVGGRAAGLADIRFRFGWLMLVGLLIQVVLFSPAVTDVIGRAGPPIYVGSTVLVAAALLTNWRITGVPIIVLGALSNLAAIVSNGGYMPADPAAVVAAGGEVPTTYSNSAIVAHPVLQPLTDIFALPEWLPFTNVFSVGDVLIAVGVCVVIVAAMRRTVQGSSVPAAPPA